MVNAAPSIELRSRGQGRPVQLFLRQRVAYESARSLLHGSFHSLCVPVSLGLSRIPPLLPASGLFGLYSGPWMPPLFQAPFVLSA